MKTDPLGVLDLVLWYILHFEQFTCFYLQLTYSLLYRVLNE